MITRISTREQTLNKPAFALETSPQDISSLDLQEPKDDEDDLEEEDDIDTDDTIDDEEILKTGTDKDDPDNSAAVNEDDLVDVDDDDLTIEDFDEEDDEDEDEDKTLGTL